MSALGRGRQDRLGDRFGPLDLSRDREIPCGWCTQETPRPKPRPGGGSARAGGFVLAFAPIRRSMRSEEPHRYGSEADMPALSCDVCSRPKADILCVYE